MGGLAAFASVALLTTGFAVWVIGTTQTEVKENVKVSVDTANNNSIVMQIEMSDSEIKLAEPEAVTGKIVNVKADDAKENPLRIGYNTITISYGTSYTFDYKSIEFEIVDPETDETGYATVKTAEGANKLSGTYARSGTEFTYIEAPNAIDISRLTATENGNTKTITLPENTLDFKWGSFFDGKSPATFYNEKYKGEEDYTILTSAADEITTELTDMKNQLNGKQIKLVAKLSKTAVVQ